MEKIQGQEAVSEYIFLNLFYFIFESEKKILFKHNIAFRKTLNSTCSYLYCSIFSAIVYLLFISSGFFLIKIPNLDQINCYINYLSGNDLFITSFADQSLPGLTFCDLFFFFLISLYFLNSFVISAFSVRWESNTIYPQFLISHLFYASSCILLDVF